MEETPRVDAYKKFLPLGDPWECFAKMTAKARELELECNELIALTKKLEEKLEIYENFSHKSGCPGPGCEICSLNSEV